MKQQISLENSKNEMKKFFRIINIKAILSI